MAVLEEMDAAQEFEAELISRQKAMHEATACGNSAVQQFYNNTVVFVTGGSGFLGKQFIEKLFRATNISKMFVILRSKKGKTIQQRLNEMFQDPNDLCFVSVLLLYGIIPNDHEYHMDRIHRPTIPIWYNLVIRRYNLAALLATLKLSGVLLKVFDMVRQQKPNFEENILAVEGDVSELRLGLSDKNWNMVSEQTDIIFHMAATTRFDECLRVSTMINVRGTREALLLGKACKKLKSFVHVSTAYSYACENLINAEVLEQFYPSPVDPETLIQLAETVAEERLNDMTAGLIKNWPNTYSFAKAVAEEAVRNLGGDLPVCIVRPAIVICAKREPNPGWLDMSCVYGASAVVIGPGTGLMHVVYINEDVNIGLIPVDYVNNAIIAAGRETVHRRAAGDTDIKIYNVISSSRNPTTFNRLVSYMRTWKLQQTCTTPAAVCLNFGLVTKNPLLFWIYSWLLHLIPGYIIDGICLIIGKQRRFVRLYKKMYKMSIALSYFTKNNWKFDDANTAALFENLSETDKQIFEFDAKNIDWFEYLQEWCIGLRKYVVKDELKGTRYGLKKQFVFIILMAIFTPLYIYMLYKIVSIPILIVSSLFNVIFANTLC